MTNPRIIRAQTDLSRPQPPQLTAQTRKEVAGGQFFLSHAVIVAIGTSWSSVYSNTDPFVTVAIIRPVANFPTTPSYQFVVNEKGVLRTWTAYCEPPLRGRHYAQWGWRGTLNSAAPVWDSAMRTVRVYPSDGLLYVEHKWRVRETHLTGGHIPSDCYPISDS